MSGLIAGFAENATIENIQVSLQDMGGNAMIMGGLVGSTASTTLSNVHMNTIDLNINQYSGGLIGEAYAGTTIKDSSVIGLNIVYYCEAEHCAIGGLIGYVHNNNAVPVNISTSSVTQSRIETSKNGGGLIGLVDLRAYVNIDNSYSIVELDVYKYSGGIFGQVREDKYQNYTHGNVTLKNIYAAGKVRDGSCDDWSGGGDSNCGTKGIVGNLGKTHTRVKSTQSFFDKDTTGRENSGDKYKDDSNDIYITDAISNKKMETKQTFIDANWSEEIWTLADGKYPRLK